MAIVATFTGFKDTVIADLLIASLDPSYFNGQIWRSHTTGTTQEVLFTQSVFSDIKQIRPLRNFTLSATSLKLEGRHFQIHTLIRRSL